MKQLIRRLKKPICLIQLGFAARGNELPHMAATWLGRGVAAKG